MDEQNFLVMDSNSANVNDVLVDNGPGKIFTLNLTRDWESDNA